ncbi:hypothetical protein QBC43DRAFT_357679 [Cladorrhinum sp. PSN259]|nr:hypothetical protein QBC43DRAFT_357679 [Cladorrhinum sp. PSN259]
MHRLSFTVPLALLALLVEHGQGNCAADNCLRAMRATQTPGRLETAQSLCSALTATSMAHASIPTFASSACTHTEDVGFSSRLSSACSCIMSTTATTLSSTTENTRTPTPACEIVSSSWAAQKAISPSELAYNCLNSVPLGKNAAIELVEAIEPYLEWQSDSAYKADPPQDYFFPPHDVFAALAKVKANLQADKYANEYEFQEDLYISVFGKAHDGHFVFYPDALSRAFEWGRRKALVSISSDGSSLPVIKLYDDLISSPSTASIVQLINGVDAATYIKEHIYKATYNQDPDAAYNSMFYSKASVAAGSPLGYFAAGGRIRYIYPGPNTTVTFENGTVLTLENIAAVKANMTGVTDGASYYAKFCSHNGPISSTTSQQSQVNAADSSAVVSGYPKPVIITSDEVLSGYYLEGPDLDDVAVVAVLSFGPSSIAEFQATLRDFLREALAAGKTKLIIDLQGNGGGYILQGYDFYRQLFPSITQEDFSRWKESASFTAEAHIVSDLVAGVNPHTEASRDLILTYQSWFNYRYDLNLTNSPFPSFDAKFPTDNIYKSTHYTSLMRWNINDSLTTINTTFGLGIEIAGYGALSNLTQPFAAENIVLLYDGACASTCAIASSFLRHQANVKSIAMGGRPNPGLIQGVGGVKGAQVLQFSNVYSYAQRYLPSAQNDAQRAELSRFSSLPMNRSTSAALNVRDQILPQNLKDGVPAQFINEKADCRLYWTEEMIKDVREVWNAAARAAFNGAGCAAGGIEKTAESGQKKAQRPQSKPGVRISETVEKVKAPIDDELWLAHHELRAIE